MAGSLRNTPLQQSYCTNTADNGRLESQRLGTHVHTGEKVSDDFCLVEDKLPPDVFQLCGPW